MRKYYRTLKSPVRGSFKDRGSKFLAYAFPTNLESEVTVHLGKLKKEHPKARHFCYAFRIGEFGELERSNDDGEPSGTAGKPILGQLIKFDLTNILLVVVRYFGGTKLGVSGLINAYRKASSYTLEEAVVLTHLIGDQYRFRTDYSIGASLIDEAKKLECQLIEQEFREYVDFLLLIPRHDAEQTVLRLLKNLTNLDFNCVDDYQKFIQVKRITPGDGKATFGNSDAAI